MVVLQVWTSALYAVDKWHQLWPPILSQLRRCQRARYKLRKSRTAQSWARVSLSSLSMKGRLRVSSPAESLIRQHPRRIHCLWVREIGIGTVLHHSSRSIAEVLAMHQARVSGAVLNRLLGSIKTSRITCRRLIITQSRQISRSLISLRKTHRSALQLVASSRRASLHNVTR